MNQMGLALYSGTIQFYTESDLKVLRLSAIHSSYLARFTKHDKSNTTFWHEIVIIFSPIYLPEVTYVITSFNLMIEL